MKHALFSSATSLLGLVLTGGIVGCVHAPDELSVASPMGVSEISSDLSLTSETGAWPQLDWWTQYGDSQLTELIEAGLENAPDMARIAARIRKAESAIQIADTASSPILSLELAPSLDKQSYNNGFPKQFVPQGLRDRGRVALNASYDFDYWGRTKAELAAALSEREAIRLDGELARLILTTSIMDAYIDLASLHTEHDLRSDALKLRENTLDLVTKREANGLATKADVRLAESNVSTAKAELATTEISMSVARNGLAYLIGEGPDRGLGITRPQLPKMKPRGLPDDTRSDLLARRPDVQAARLRIEALNQHIKAARTDYFPSIRINALAGLQSLGLGNLISTDSTMASLAPAISLPLYRQDQLDAQFEAVQADYDLAVVAYNETVLSAYRDVADAVTARNQYEGRFEDTLDALALAEDAYRIAQLRYDGGLSNYLDVLVIEERVLAARAEVARQYSIALKLDLSLVRALGGGFETGQTHLATETNAMKENADG